ncbi:MAG: Sir2 family NAD-dependent protein deacetylase [Alphaproteobacteria bacterium]|nr:Sir2 family NAD-dependent protein deacetylase [Alphaproteobacteria bacterium]
MAFADQDDVVRLRDMIEAAGSVVIFTGAGISTESGIPDFRSPGGLWTKYQPIDFRDFMASEEMRRESWRRKFAMDQTINSAEPNRGHRAVERLVNRGKVSAVITQNVDGLHQASGIPDEQVIELHGNSTYAKCLTCGLRHELTPIKAAFVADETMPVCTACGSEYMKTATISFGQSMPEEQMARAQRETLACDLFIAIGSSLVVYPAAGFPVMAKQNGAGMVILNREATDLDGHADLVINGEIGPILGDAAEVN